jgi:hypothetical protein
MKLDVRHNHFFRSFWTVTKLNNDLEITMLDLKYMDLTITTTDQLAPHAEAIEMMARRDKSRRCLFSWNMADASYWDTYNMADGDLVWGIITILYGKYYSNSRSYHADGTVTYRYKFFQDSAICGMKNFRTDNMSSSIFALAIRRLLPENYNKNWKTAHMIYMDIASPHWNMYKHYLDDHKVRYKHGDSESDSESDSKSDSEPDSELYIPRIVPRVIPSDNSDTDSDSDDDGGAWLINSYKTPKGTG